MPINKIQKRCRHLLISDARIIGTQLRKLRQTKPEPAELAAAINSLQQKLATAEQRLATRRAQVPKVAYKLDLPVVSEREHIKELISQNQVLVLCGETGSGKTTQLPKICLELGLGVRGLIGHTQPRRIAARSVAARVAAELGGELGDIVGYKVRFDEKLSANCMVKIMTDGILLAETANDKFLQQYDTIIIDEAHERSLNIDFLLGYIKRILPRRPDLKVIITSATIDPECFARHFNNAPIKLVEGRSYPVKIEYRPSVDLQQNPLELIVETLGEIINTGAGDVLIFLAGEREIRELHNLIKHAEFANLEVLALYGRLSNREQARIFAPSSKRKVVLATNVAETSLTVAGIVYVIDSGMARIARYSYKSKIARLPIEPISQASAKQRAGRCGRVMAGICYRTYSLEDFEARAEFTEPEILRSNLAAVILQMEALKLGHIDDFDFIDRPDSRLINDGYKLLLELGAVTRGAGYKLSKLGRDMARLPIDPKLARMLLAAPLNHALSELLTLCAFLSIQDPRERPQNNKSAADLSHETWRDPRSDFVAILNLFSHFNKSREDLSANQLRKWCSANFLNYVRMREWQDTRRQLATLAKSLNLLLNKTEASYQQIHQSLLVGLIGNIGQRDENNYLGRQNRRFLPFPTSGIKKKAPWIMAAELIETSRVYAHNCAQIEPVWLESVGAHLIKSQYGEPYFVGKTGQVCADAKLRLYGLLINAKKRVNFAPIDKIKAREVFIREALVEMQLQSRAPFLRHNQRQIDKLRLLEAKFRRVDLLEDGQARYEFYADKLPANVVDAASFENWRQQAERENPQLLFFSARHISANNHNQRADLYPDMLDFGGCRLPLSYHFAPQQADDGVSVHVPVAALKQIPAHLPAWLVAGMLPEKLCQLIKSLPKNKRVAVIPAPEYAAKALPLLAPRSGELLPLFAQALRRLSGADIDAADFELAKLDEHLFMRVVVHDDSGKILATGRDLAALQIELNDHADAEFYAGQLHELERDNISTWDFGELPTSVDFEQNGIKLKGYPALVDMQTSVSIRLIGTIEEQQYIHRDGLKRLFELSLSKELKYLRRNLQDIDKISLWYAALGDKASLIADIEQAILQQVFLASQSVHNREQFMEQLTLGKANMQTYANQICKQLVDIFYLYSQLKKRIGKALPISWIEACADINQQLSELIFTGFVSRCTANLAEYPRYLQAIMQRLDKIDHAPDKDRQRRAQVEPLAAKLAQFKARDDAKYWQAFWALQELRVSEFAQALGTKIKISPQRMDNLIRELARG